MHDDNIIRMANDIGNFYRSEPIRENAIAGVVSHISRFWARRMRDKLIAYAKQPDSGLSELSLEAVRRLAAHSAAKAAGPKVPGETPQESDLGG
jgi:formate dehydrogenase subunit delta